MVTGLFATGNNENSLALGSPRLDLLLDTDQVSSFKRESGWVVVGRDPVRGQSRRVTYPSVERRDITEGELSQKRNLSMKSLAEEAEALLQDL